MQRETLVLLALAGCDAAIADPPPKVDAKADQLLHKMSASLAAAKSFQVDCDHSLEYVLKDGEKLQFLAESRVLVQRPNKVRSDRLGAFADLGFYYNGKQITLFGKRANLYATSPAPDNLDAAIDFAREDLGLEAPAADLLYSDAYTGMMDDVISGQYVGNEPVGDKMCHHLAYHGHHTDWQIWIEDTPQSLPCRYVITTTETKGEPQFAVALKDWNLAPSIPADTFDFKPPASAMKIDFVPRGAKDKKGGKS